MKPASTSTVRPDHGGTRIADASAGASGRRRRGGGPDSTLHFGGGRGQRRRPRPSSGSASAYRRGQARRRDHAVRAACPARTIPRAPAQGQHRLLIDNGANTIGLAEQWFSAGQGARHAVVCLIGYGVGASIMTRARRSSLPGGTNGAMRQPGVLSRPGACRCGSLGHLEAR